MEVSVKNETQKDKLKGALREEGKQAPLARKV